MGGKGCAGAAIVGVVITSGSYPESAYNLNAMKTVLFASTNQAKIEQFQFVADEGGFGVVVESAYRAFPGMQPYSEEYSSQMEIVESGAKEIYRQVRRPVVVEDTILEVEALDGRPGLKSNEFLKQRGIDGLLAAVSGKRNRRARITSIAGVFDGRVMMIAKNMVDGRVAAERRYKWGEPAWVGPSFHPFGGGFNSVFELPETGKTLAEHSAREGLRLGYREPNFRMVLSMPAAITGETVGVPRLSR